MRKRIIILLGIALAIVAITIIVVINGSSNSTFKQDFHIQDIASVDKLYLADKQDNEVTLTRQADSTWLVDGIYPASLPMVDMLLETLNTMRIRQQVNKNAIPNVVKDISSRGIKVEVYQQKPRINWFGGLIRLFPKEQLTATYYVGRETQDLLASYFYREGDSEPYIINIPGFRGFLTPRFVTDPLKWRSHSIVNLPIQAIQSVQLQIPNTPQESFAIERDGQGFSMRLLQSHEYVPYFDTARVAQMLASFASLSFDEFASIVPNSNDTSFNVGPRTILSITDTAGNNTELRTYIKYVNPDDMAAISNPQLYESFDINRLYAILNNKDTILIQYYVFDNILQPASYFLGRTNSTSSVAINQ